MAAVPRSSRRSRRSSKRRPSPSADAPGRPFGQSWIVRLLLVVAGLLVGFLLAETAARVFDLARTPSPRRAVYAGQSHEWCCGPEVIVDGLQRFEPLTSFQHCYDGARREYLDAAGCVTYHINNWGYRGADFSLDKPPDVYRVVVLGDSFTFGEGTPDTQVFPARLEAGLSRERLDGKRVEVINLGIPAADTRAEVATYLRFARRLAPDWVILEWNTNDYPTSQVQQDHLRLIGANYRDVFTDTAVLSWSRLLTFARRQWKLRGISRDLIRTTATEAERGRGALEGIGVLAGLAKDDGARFTLLIFPEIIRLDDYPYASVVDLVRTYARDRALEVVDLLPALSGYRDRDLWVHDTDHHPNPTAHQIAASALLAHARR